MFTRAERKDLQDVLHEARVARVIKTDACDRLCALVERESADKSADFVARLTPDDARLLRALSRDINRTAYHGGLGLAASGRYLAILDRLIAACGEDLS